VLVEVSGLFSVSLDLFSSLFSFFSLSLSVSSLSSAIYFSAIDFVAPAATPVITAVPTFVPISTIVFLALEDQ